MYLFSKSKIHKSVLEFELMTEINDFLKISSLSLKGKQFLAKYTNGVKCYLYLRDKLKTF
jgi:hypothetical protein